MEPFMADLLFAVRGTALVADANTLKVTLPGKSNREEPAGDSFPGDIRPSPWIGTSLKTFFRT